MMPAARRALAFVPPGCVVGLGSGHAATAFIRALGEAVASGLQVRGVATSFAAAREAARLGIAPVAFDEVEWLDVSVDGADEVSPRLELIKGYGGALVREKIVHAASREVVVVVGREKLVDRLGSRGRLPLEVLPFGCHVTARRVSQLTGCATMLRRQEDGSPWVSDNGNWLLDCVVGPIEDPPALDRALHAIPGVVGTGLFLGMANVVLVQHEGEAMEMRQPQRSR
jgi:ribose 5-phosphate isomerase A